MLLGTDSLDDLLLLWEKALHFLSVHYLPSDFSHLTRTAPAYGERGSGGGVEGITCPAMPIHQVFLTH